MNITNIFRSNDYYRTNPYREEDDVFYNAVEYQDNIEIDEVFKAEYNYGPKEEQVIKKNIIINFFHTLIARLCKSLVFPGSCRKLDKQRSLKTKHELKAVGGKSVALETPDGDTVSGVYLKASDFKKSIEKYFYVFEENKKSFYNSSNKFLALRNEHCIEKQKGSIFSYVQMEPTDGAKQFIEYLEGLHFTNISSNASVPFQESKEASTTKKVINYLESFLYSKAVGYNLPIYSLSQKEHSLPSVDDERTSHPTVIISGGNNALSGSYKDTAIFFLSRGMNVLLMDFRGHGDSTGIPTSDKTKLDLETAYQYLSKEKGVKNKDLLVYGHCQGAGSSTDLAARRKGVNIMVDRSFANYHTILKEKAPRTIYSHFSAGVHTSRKFLKKNILPKIYLLNEEKKARKNLKKLSNDILSWIKEKKVSEKLSKIAIPILSTCINYDNATNLSKIEGKIAFVISKEDNIIPAEEYKKQRNSCAEKTKIFTDLDHSGGWVDTGRYNESCKETYKKISSEINDFLIDANLYRRVF